MPKYLVQRHRLYQKKKKKKFPQTKKQDNSLLQTVGQAGHIDEKKSRLSEVV